MYQGKTVDAVLPAAGSGTRFGAGYNKAFVTLGDAPLFVHALRTLCAHPAISITAIIITISNGRIFFMFTPPVKCSIPIFYIIPWDRTHCKRKPAGGGMIYNIYDCPKK